MLLPSACLWGAVALLSADVLAQFLSSEGRIIPTGILAACLAAPALIFILRKIKSEASTRASILWENAVYAKTGALHRSLLNSFRIGVCRFHLW